MAELVLKGSKEAFVKENGEKLEYHSFFVTVPFAGKKYRIKLKPERGMGADVLANHLGLPPLPNAEEIVEV